MELTAVGEQLHPAAHPWESSATELPAAQFCAGTAGGRWLQVPIWLPAMPSQTAENQEDAPSPPSA